MVNVLRDLKHITSPHQNDPFFAYLFGDFSVENYLQQHKIHELFGVDMGLANTKVDKGLYTSVDPKHAQAYVTELDDLARLHYLLTSRKVTTVLEFGVGKSTKAIAHAMRFNKSQHAEHVKANLRRSNPFELHSVDCMKEWIDVCLSEMPDDLKGFVDIHHCTLRVSEFNGRMCTYYDNFPNICPDFIYLDAPDQFSAQDNLRGLTTAHPDRMPMAADILSFEHFLLPGTLILVDGRTANARFLKCNLQRNWRYTYVEQFDQHFFELHEPPLGKINKRQIEFCLKPEFFENL